MTGLMSADEIFEQAQNAAAAATGLDEKAMQIDYPVLKEKIRAALGDRKVALCHINKFLPEGYEDQGRFNLVSAHCRQRAVRHGHRRFVFSL